MQVDDLKSKLASRLENQCGETPALGSLEAPLEHARFEYSRFNPKIDIQEFSLPVDEVRVSLTDDQGDPLPIVYVHGVYIEQPVPSYPLGQGYGAPLDEADSYYFFQGRSASGAHEMPSLYFIESKYRDAYSYEVAYYRNQNEMIITPPSTTRGTVKGMVVYGTVREWGEISDFEERLILDRAMAEFIDYNLVAGRGGVIRIPSPHGSFEFDGGRVVLSLRDKLIDDFESKLNSRTSIITQG